MKASKKVPAVRYSDATRKAILVFLKTNTNVAAKLKFGCSAHWAGQLRAEARIPFADAPKKTAPKAKPAKKAKVKGGAAARAIAAVKGLL